MEHNINILALDEHFEIITILNYSQLQWTRAYYEPGKFTMEIPVSQYDPAMKYIYTKDRPEMGVITQRNYIVRNRVPSYNLSGYFLENQLNRRVAYEKGTTNITNAPTWNRQTGRAEDVATAYFNAFKTVVFNQEGTTYTSTLNITAEASKGRGNQADHERENEKLGSKIYKILKPSEMSYRVSYDFLTNKMMFSCWKGIDRTQDNTEKNNQIVFSTRFGNLKDPNILIDETSYANGSMAIVTASEGNDHVKYVEARLERKPGETQYDDSFTTTSPSLNKQDYSTEAEFTAALQNSNHIRLGETIRKMNVDFDALTGSYEYLKDFDLGDKCSIEIPEIGLSADAVLIGCYEVIKQGRWTLTLEFGTPLLK